MIRFSEVEVDVVAGDIFVVSAHLVADLHRIV
jgi:hypothetical protein